MNYHHTLRQERLTSNSMLIVLLKLKKIKALWIVIVFSDYIIQKTAKRFSNILYQPLSLSILLFIIKK